MSKVNKKYAIYNNTGEVSRYSLYTDNDIELKKLQWSQNCVTAAHSRGTPHICMGTKNNN